MKRTITITDDNTTKGESKLIDDNEVLTGCKRNILPLLERKKTEGFMVTSFTSTGKDFYHIMITRTLRETTMLVNAE